MTALALVLALLVGCESDSFTDVQKADSIEAYEGFAQRNPGSIYQPEIDGRLEQLYFDKAERENTAAAWKAVIEKYPKSKKIDKANAGLATFLFEEARKTDTLDGWKSFLAEAKALTDDQRRLAEGRSKVLEYGKLEVGAPNVMQINLAEDPAGPKNGWGLEVEVKNNGDQALGYLQLEVTLNGPDGAELERARYPMVSPKNPMPHPEIEEKPLAPGEARKWSFMSAKVPIEVTPTATVRAVALTVASAPADPPK